MFNFTVNCQHSEIDFFSNRLFCFYIEDSIVRRKATFNGIYLEKFITINSGDFKLMSKCVFRYKIQCQRGVYVAGVLLYC